MNITLLKCDQCGKEDKVEKMGFFGPTSPFTLQVECKGHNFRSLDFCSAECLEAFAKKFKLERDNTTK